MTTHESDHSYAKVKRLYKSPHAQMSDLDYQNNYVLKDIILVSGVTIPGPIKIVEHNENWLLTDAGQWINLQHVSSLVVTSF